MEQRMHSVLALAVLALAPVEALSQVVPIPPAPLPKLESESLGIGVNPVFGDAGLSRRSVHFNQLDGAAPGYSIWDPASRSTFLSPIYNGNTPGFSPQKCTWGGKVLFCSGYAELVPNYYVDLLRSHHFAAGRTIDQIANPGELRDGLRDSFDEFAIVQMSDGRIEMFEHWEILPTLNRVFVANVNGDAHPVVSRDSHSNVVVYQEFRNGSWFVNVWKGYLIASINAGPFAPRPSQFNVPLIAVDDRQSVRRIHMEGLWPVNPSSYDPANAGCSEFRQLKFARNDMWLVEGIDCPDGPSALYVIYNNVPDNTHRPFFVGLLDPANPEYDAWDDEIVYANHLGEVIWLKADVNSFGPTKQEVEPNDQLSNATPVYSWQTAEGTIDEDGIDYWAVELSASKSYHIEVNLEPDLCYWSTPVEVRSADGTLLAYNSMNTKVVNGVPLTNYCGVLENFTPPVDGMYYVGVGSDYTWYAGYRLTFE